MLNWLSKHNYYISLRYLPSLNTNFYAIMPLIKSNLEFTPHERLGLGVKFNP